MGSLPLSIQEIDLSRRDRIVLYYLVGPGVLVFTDTIAYTLAMAQLEGVSQSVFAPFEFIVQTMTTAGYGQDSGLWSYPLMFLVVALTQISGIAIGFLSSG